VKPFFFDTFRERLEKYGALRARMSRVREADQVEIAPDLLASARAGAAD
jgi:response regulator of citrate/malate metabolism